MATIDQVEKGGRFVLWLVLAAAAAVVPIGAYGLASASARTAEQVRQDALKEATKEKAEKAAKEAASKPARLTLASMGSVMNMLEGSVGTIWFSNASSRQGVVCIQGTASAGQQSTKSLATCNKVDAYETNVKMSVMFAGASIKSICPAGTCAFDVNDVPAELEPTAVAAK